jgi:hypothetical protein
VTCKHVTPERVPVYDPQHPQGDQTQYRTIDLCAQGRFRGEVSKRCHEVPAEGPCPFWREPGPDPAFGQRGGAALDGER